MKYVNQVPGYNSRLDPIQAAVLRVKLKVLDEWNERRRAIAARYLAGFGADRAPGIRDLPTLIPSHVLAGTEPVWYLFLIRHPRRNELQQSLTQVGIGTMILYPIPPHLQGAYAYLGYCPGIYPIAEAMAKQVISLPLGPQLSSDSVGAVSNAVTQIVRYAGVQGAADAAESAGGVYVRVGCRWAGVVVARLVAVAGGRDHRAQPCPVQAGWNGRNFALIRRTKPPRPNCGRTSAP